MKTYPNFLRIASQNILIALIVLITLFGLSLKTNAQSLSLGVDEHRITTSMKIKLNSFDFDVVVPRITIKDLEAFTDINFNHMVYVSDEKPGFYMFINNQWTKTSVKDVLATIEMNLLIGNLLAEDIILTANNSRNLLDYNSHVDHLYEGFVFEDGSNQLAVLIQK